MPAVMARQGPQWIAARGAADEVSTVGMPGTPCEAAAQAFEQGRARRVCVESPIEEELGCPVGAVIGGRSTPQLFGSEELEGHSRGRPG